VALLQSDEDTVCPTEVKDWSGDGTITMTTSNIPNINTPCCQQIHVINQWDSGSVYQIGGTKNGKAYWTNSAKTYAIWYDGDSGVDFDWMFGDFNDMVNDQSGKMYSDKESTCPTDITSWTNDDTARLTCTGDHRRRF